MDQVIDILKSLGINETLFFQFGLFFIAWLAMNFIVFKPYFMAYEERIRRTLGSQEETENILQQAEQKKQEYEILAKKLNGTIRSIFSESNEKSKKEVEEILSQAKRDSEFQSKELHKKLELSIIQVQKDLKDHIPNISSEIQRKFMEIS